MDKISKLKKIIYKVRNHKIYRRMLGIYLVSILTVVTLIIMSSYGIFLNYYKKQTNYYLEQLMGQITFVFSNINNQISDVNTTLSNDKYFERYISFETPNKIIDYDLFFRLTDIKDYYPYILNISVVNLKTNSLVSTRRSKNNDVIFIKDTLKFRNGDIGFFYRDKIFLDGEITNSQKVISFVKYFENKSAGIIIDLPLQTFQKSFTMVNKNESLNEVYIVDDTLKIIPPVIHTNLHTVSNEIPRLLSLNKESSSFIHNDEENSLVYFFSRPQNMNCWFICVQSNAIIYAQFQKHCLFSVIISLVLALIGCVIFWKYTSKTYQPLFELLKKYKHIVSDISSLNINEYDYLKKIISQMEHEQYINEQTLKHEYIKNLLMQENIDISFTEEMNAWHDKFFSHSYYCVLLIKITPSENNFISHSQNELDLIRYAVRNISEEIFSKTIDCLSANIADDKVGLILALNTDTISDYSNEIQQIRCLLRQNHSCEALFCLGNVVIKNEISISYKTAEQYLKLNFHLNQDGFIDSNQYLNVNYLNKNTKLTKSILEYISQNYSDPNLCITNVSQAFDLSSTYVGKIFKAVNGNSFSAYLSEYRLITSKTLLIKSNDSINDIAQKVGFSNQTYYTTLFKKQFGLTPTQYRSTHLI